MGTNLKMFGGLLARMWGPSKAATTQLPPVKGIKRPSQMFGSAAIRSWARISGIVVKQDSKSRSQENSHIPTRILTDKRRPGIGIGCLMKSMNVELSK